MKWMVLCFSLSVCSNPDVVVHGSYRTQEECVAEAKHMNDVWSNHYPDEKDTYQCISIPYMKGANK